MDTVHSSIPEDKRTKANTEMIKCRIKEVVLPCIQGKKHAMTSSRIANLIQIKKTPTNQGIRKAMKDLLVDEAIPVIACAKGFFVAIYLEEVEDYISTTSKRILGLQRNIRCLEPFIKEEACGT